MLEENKSGEPAAGDWVWFIGAVHMDTHGLTHTHVYTHARLHCTCSDQVTDTHLCKISVFIQILM